MNLRFIMSAIDRVSFSSKCKSASSKHPFFHYGLYSIPYSGAIFLMAPMAIVQGIYSKYHGVSLTDIAMVI